MYVIILSTFKYKVLKYFVLYNILKIGKKGHEIVFVKCFYFVE